MGLALLSLALVCGLLGFLFHAFWLLAIILMGAVWGLMIAGFQRGSGESRSLAADVVAVVVEEAREIGDTVSELSADRRPKP